MPQITEKRGRADMRIIVSLLLLVVAACAPTPSDEARPGVGYDDYSAYQAGRAERATELTGQAGGAPAISGEELRAAGLPAGGRDGGSEAIFTPAPRVDVNNPGISDEQSFEAVSSRESIESDAARIAANRQAYREIQPTALPRRQGSDRPNIVQYALTTTNRVGESLYRRSGFNARNRYNRACGSYASPDLAQEDFLDSGGPARDRRGVDPDGDGFACSWDPQPFRAAGAAR